MLFRKWKVYFGEIGTGKGVISHGNDFFGYLIEKNSLISLISKHVFAKEYYHVLALPDLKMEQFCAVNLANLKQ